MTKTIRFEESRVFNKVIIPNLKSICPKEKSYYSDGTFFIIYNNDDKVFPNVCRIDEKLSKLYHKKMVKCYISARDSVTIIESILFPNIEKREIFASMVEELSALHDTKGKNIKDIVIEYDKIEEIYGKYKAHLKPACNLYIFSYYWPSLCIALDFRRINGIPTVIHRSLIVKDALALIRQQIRREDYCDSWDDVKEKAGPADMITNIEYTPVTGYERVDKYGRKIQVEPHGRLKVTTE